MLVIFCKVFVCAPYPVLIFCSRAFINLNERKIRYAGVFVYEKTSETDILCKVCVCAPYPVLHFCSQAFLNLNEGKIRYGGVFVYEKKLVKLIFRIINKACHFKIKKPIYFITKVSFRILSGKNHGHCIVNFI